ncbi:hypothetical protein JHK86_022507 [Glycine max]|nr:hypothetical protein JHK86_022507 [Glycine max]
MRVESADRKFCRVRDVRRTAAARASINRRTALQKVVRWRRTAYTSKRIARAKLAECGLTQWEHGLTRWERGGEPRGTSQVQVATLFDIY